MANLCLILGGVRSGKSRYGFDYVTMLAEKHNAQKIFIATAPHHVGMDERIRAHQKTRGHDWHTEEITLDLAAYIKTSSPEHILLIDCMSLWLNNLIYHQKDWREAMDELSKELTQCQSHVVMVSNEMGHAPHHEHETVRQFVDWHGEMNQKLAQMAEEVYFITATLAQKLK